MKRKKALLSAAMAVIIIAAFVLISFPVLSNYLSEKHHSEVRTEHYEQIEKLDDETLWNAEKEAIQYNSLLSNGIIDNSKSLVNTDYINLLNINKDGIMGYIEIPSISVYLPIAHGTDAKNLQDNVGHVIGSSLPVGGMGTHTVLSGHSGLAAQTMFNDLGQLKEGDMVYIHVLKKVLAYMVDSTNTVLPSDVSLLSIRPDKDELTLVTCTPIGVNTHRLLVNCSRTEYTAEEETNTQQAQNAEKPQSEWLNQYFQGICLGAVILALAALLCIVSDKLKKRGNIK